MVGNRHREGSARVGASAVATLAVLSAALGLVGCGDRGERATEDGLAALAGGETRLAAEKLEEAARKNPASATVQCNLGLAYWRLDDREGAAMSFRKAADLNAQSPLPLEYLVQVEIEAGRTNAAREAFEELRSEFAALSPRVLTAMAVLEWRGANPEATRDYLEQALAIAPDYPPALYNLAVVLRTGETLGPEVRDLLGRYLAVAGDDPHAAVARGYLEAASAGVEAGGRGTPAGGGSAAATGHAGARQLIDAARKAVGNESFDEALVLLKEAMRIEPDSRDALWELARLYEVSLKDPAKATQTYAAFKSRFPDDPRLRQVQQAATRDPEAAGKAFSAGIAAYRAGRYDEAIKDYREALRLDSQRSDAAYNLGLTYKAKGDLERARDEFVYALSVQPDMLDALYMLALTCRELGVPAKAMENLDTLLKTDATYAKAHLLRGYIFQDQGRHDRAVTEFRRYIELAPPGDPSAARLAEWLKATGGR